MAVVGEAHIIVKAITTGIDKEIKRAFKNIESESQASGTRAGNLFGDSYNNALKDSLGSINTTALSKFAKDAGNTLGKEFKASFEDAADNINIDTPKIDLGRGGGKDSEGGILEKALGGFSGGEAAKARAQLANLARTSYFLQGALGPIAAALTDVVSGIGALAGAAGGAVGSIASLSGVLSAFAFGMIASKLALGGVAKAVTQATTATGGYKKTLKELREEMQQLRFDAEDAAISEKEAALNLEKARENLARVQDLPPNSRARREAELEYERADLALRRAIDRSNDLQDQINNPVKKGAGAGNDPFKNLTASQVTFAKFLISMKPKLNELKEAAASGFLPVLATQIRRMTTSIPQVDTFFSVIKNGLHTSGAAVGSGLSMFVNSITSPRNLANMKAIFGSFSGIFQLLGKSLGNSFTAFLSITKAAAPATRDMLLNVQRITAQFAAFVGKAESSGALTDFFLRANKLAGYFGQALGNIGGFFADIVRTNFGPGSGGEYMIMWLKTATAGWRTLMERMGQDNMSSYFKNASENARQILVSIGALIKQFGQLAGMSEIKETFKILAVGAESVGYFLKEGAKAGPLFAQLIVNVIQFTTALAESEGLKTFFRVLSDTAGMFNDMLKQIMASDFGRWLVNAGGQITAFVAAIGLVTKVLTFLLVKVIAGSLIQATAALAGFVVGLVATPAAGFAAAAGIRAVGAAIQTFGGPVLMAIGLVVGAIVAIDNGLKQAKLDALGTAEAISNIAKAKNVSGMEVLSTAIGDLTGDFKAHQKIVRGNLDVSEDYKYSVEEMMKDSDAFKITIRSLSAEMNNYSNGGGSANDAVKLAFQKTGSAIAEIARTDLKVATSEFKSLADAQGVTGKDLEYLLESMPDLKQALIEQANAAGVSASNQNLVNIAMQKGSAYTDTLATQMYGVGGAAKAADEDIKKLEDTIFNFGKVNLDTRAALRSFKDAEDTLTESLKKNGATLDINTTAGRANQAALDSMVKAGLDNAQAMFEQSHNSDQLQTNMTALRKKVMDSAIAFGKSKDEATKLADQLVGSEYDIQLKIKSITEAEVKKAVEDSKKAIRDNGFSSYSFAMGILGTSPSARKNGGLIGFASGGLAKFAPGGFVSGLGGPRSDMIPAMLSNGEFVMNANSTSRYLPLLNSLNQAGLDSYNKSPNGAANLGSNISIVVNPSPGMSETDLAHVVSRQLAFELRNGGLA